VPSPKNSRPEQNFCATQEELRVQQEELAQKNRSLEAQGRQLELGRSEAEARARELAQANRYKSQFLANMSHELRTPLNSILILARHLAENAAGHLDSDEVESAGVIHESGSQLLSLINDILDLSKIEAGKVEMLIEDFPVSEMLLYLRRLFEPLAAKKSIAFAIDAEAAATLMIHSDRRLLTQVLTNLLSNAVKFTDQRFGLSQRAPRIRDCVSTSSTAASASRPTRSDASSTPSSSSTRKPRASTAAPAWAWRSAASSSDCWAAEIESTARPAAAAAFRCTCRRSSATAAPTASAAVAARTAATVAGRGTR
jgi:hypothetical protein